MVGHTAVSYTHLTLPTILRVFIASGSGIPDIIIPTYTAEKTNS